MACLSDDIEQVVAFERSPRSEVRSWIAVEERPVSGPLDLRLARITLYSSHVVGLGICGPWTLDGSRVAGRIIAVELLVATPGGPAAVNLGVPEPITLELGGQDAAVLYGPPPASIASQSPITGPSPGAPTNPSGTGGIIGGGLPLFATWPTGAYAIAFAFASDGSTVVRWLGIDLIAPAGEPD
jgi:hypothetical protein